MMRIIESLEMVEPVENWSEVRSPSRARRRMKYGHPQRIRTVYVPRKDVLRMGDTFVMHPTMAAEFRRATE